MHTQGNKGLERNCSEQWWFNIAQLWPNQMKLTSLLQQKTFGSDLSNIQLFFLGKVHQKLHKHTAFCIENSVSEFN